MERWLNYILVVLIIVIIFLFGIERAYRSLVDVRFCDDTQKKCIAAECNCDYDLIEKIKFVFNNIKDKG